MPDVCGDSPLLLLLQAVMEAAAKKKARKTIRNLFR
jgi:hypothetical protein